MSAKLLFFLLFFPVAALAQGYADLGTEAEGFAEVTAPASLSFPRDHAAHPDFRIEWWYVTANLTGPGGAEYGAQWTLFRQAARPGGGGSGWSDPQLWMGHAALTSRTSHRFAERFARGGIGQAGVALEPFAAWIDDWSLGGGTTRDPLSRITIAAEGEGFAFDLKATTEAPPVPQGIGGYSAKSQSGQASYYYSQPLYEVTGTITDDGREIPVTGQAWLDREWSSQPLTETQEGWDWFALHLEDGTRLMLYRMREHDGTPYISGTRISPDGTPTSLDPGQITMEPRTETSVAGRSIPTAWHLEIADIGVSVDTEALNPHSFMDTTFPYWEGPVRISGSHSGRGYLEMTGYGS